MILRSALLAAAIVTTPGAACDAPAAGVASEQTGEPSPAAEGRLRRFLREHGARLGIALGTWQAGRIYDRSVGHSTDPLLFDDPPGIDERVRDALMTRGSAGGSVARHGPDALRYGVPIALTLMDLRDRGLMARDLIGFLETHAMNGGLTNLLKNVVGRERPNLEFADPDDIGQPAFDELAMKDDSYRSFPSGHASGSFAYLSYLERAVARRTGLRGGARAVSFTAMYSLAGYISYTRIASDRHYLTDLVSGAALGVTVGRTYYRLNHPEEFAAKGSSSQSRLRFRMNPPCPVPGGVAVMLSVGLRPPAGR